MVDGTIASLFTGAWMPANLANSAADGAGKWRVTQMPTADGSTTNRERWFFAGCARLHQEG